jgi:hypothetical protein
LIHKIVIIIIGTEESSKIPLLPITISKLFVVSKKKGEEYERQRERSEENERKSTTKKGLILVGFFLGSLENCLALLFYSRFYKIVYKFTDGFNKTVCKFRDGFIETVCKF